MSDLGDAKATISIDVAGVTQGVTAATRSLETLDKSFVSAGQNAAKLGPAMTAPLQKVGSAIADVGKMAAGFALGGEDQHRGIGPVVVRPLDHVQELGWALDQGNGSHDQEEAPTSSGNRKAGPIPRQQPVVPSLSVNVRRSASTV